MVHSTAAVRLQKHKAPVEKLSTGNLTDLVLFSPPRASSSGAMDANVCKIFASVSAKGESSGGTTSVGKVRVSRKLWHVGERQHGRGLHYSVVPVCECNEAPAGNFSAILNLGERTWAPSHS